MEEKNTVGRNPLVETDTAENISESAEKNSEKRQKGDDAVKPEKKKSPAAEFLAVIPGLVCAVVTAYAAAEKTGVTAIWKPEYSIYLTIMCVLLAGQLFSGDCVRGFRKLSDG